MPREIYDTPIEQLDLSVRVFNSLKRTGITSVGEVLEMLERGPDAMLAIRNFGEKSLDELVSRLREKSFLTEEEKQEVIELKKKKLALKDKMYYLMTEYKKSL